MPSSACDWSSDVCSSDRSEEHTSELQSRSDLVCRLLLEKKKNTSTLRATTRYNRSNPHDPTDFFDQLLLRKTIRPLRYYLVRILKTETESLSLGRITTHI